MFWIRVRSISVRLQHLTPSIVKTSLKGTWKSPRVKQNWPQWCLNARPPDYIDALLRCEASTGTGRGKCTNDTDIVLEPRSTREITIAKLLRSTKENAYWSCRLFRNHCRGYCGPVPRVSIVMPCDHSVWAPFWTGYVVHKASISCAKTHAVKWSLAVERLQLVVASYFHFFRSFPKVKWSLVDLFQFLLANMAKLRMRISESCVAALCFPWNTYCNSPLLRQQVVMCQFRRFSQEI